MAPAKDDATRDAARRLRLTGKSHNEIADILGLPRSTVATWAREEKWPDPFKQARELKKKMKPGAQACDGPADPPKNPRKPKEPVAGSPSAIPDFDSGDFDQVIDALFRFTAPIVAEASRLSTGAALKVFELTIRAKLARAGSELASEKDEILDEMKQALRIQSKGRLKSARGDLGETPSPDKDES